MSDMQEGTEKIFRITVHASYGEEGEIVYGYELQGEATLSEVVGALEIAKSHLLKKNTGE